MSDQEAKKPTPKMFFRLSYFIGDIFVLYYNIRIYDHLLSVRDNSYARASTEYITTAFIYLTIAIILKSCMAISLSLLWAVVTICLKIKLNNPTSQVATSQVATDFAEAEITPSTLSSRGWSRFFNTVNKLFAVLGVTAILADAYISQTYMANAYHSTIQNSTAELYNGPWRRQQALRNETQRQYDCCFYRNTSSTAVLGDYATTGSQFRRPAPPECPSSWNSQCVPKASCKGDECTSDKMQATANPCNCVDVLVETGAENIQKVRDEAWSAFENCLMVNTITGIWDLAQA